MGQPYSKKSRRKIKVRRESIVIDTNRAKENVVYQGVQTTDSNRQGRPYKLFTDPGTSQVNIYIDVGDATNILNVNLMLNHCSTSDHGTIDMLVNNCDYLGGYGEIKSCDFEQQDFKLPTNFLKDGVNILTIQLNKASPGKYWLSDLRFDIEKRKKKI